LHSYFHNKLLQPQGSEEKHRGRNLSNLFTSRSVTPLAAIKNAGYPFRKEKMTFSLFLFAACRSLATVYTAKEGVKARSVTPHPEMKLVKAEKITEKQKHQCTPLFFGGCNGRIVKIFSILLWRLSQCFFRDTK
jgi:hypothetical protein